VYGRGESEEDGLKQQNGPDRQSKKTDELQFAMRWSTAREERAGTRSRTRGRFIACQPAGQWHRHSQQNGEAD
jgi:hypothetical protein